MLAVLPLLLACRADDPTDSGSPTDPPATWAAAACPVELPGAACGVATVPLRAGSGDGATITLATARFPAASGAPDNVPLVVFTGGPGSNVFDLAGAFGPGGPYAAVNEDHDLLLLAERGTFGSTPLLTCPELARVDAQFGASLEDKAAIELEAWADCHDRLVGEGVDLSAFDNAARAGDVPLVLGAMGIDRVHAWGVSGGALLAQVLVRDHPEILASVMLDSGGFPTAHMRPVATELLTNTAARFQRMFDACAADAGCGAAHPDLEARLFALAEALEASPRPTEVTHPITGETQTVQVDGDLLLRLYTNHMESVGLLPLVTDQVEAGDWSIVDSVLPGSVVTDTGTGFANGLYASVFCADLGGLSVDEVPTGGVPEALHHALGLPLSTLLDTCALWGVDEAPAGDLVGSDTIPLLVMEGMYDTNRRPEAGAEVAARFATSTLAAYADRGHVVLDACAVSMMVALMDDPTAPIDTGCVPTGVDWQ